MASARMCGSRPLEVTFQGDQALIAYMQQLCGLAAIGKVMLEADYQHRASEAEAIETQLQELEATHAVIIAFHQYCAEHPAITYTPEAWRALVNHATIHPDSTITFNERHNPLKQQQHPSPQVPPAWGFIVFTNNVHPPDPVLHPPQALYPP